MYQSALSYNPQQRVSCYKLPIFKGWLVLANTKNLFEHKNMLIHESHYVISSSMESVILFSEQFEEECIHQKIDPQTIVLLRLALVEALNNIVEHAFLSEGFNEIDIFVYYHQNSIRFELKDNGFPNQHGTKPIDIIVDRNDIMNVPEGGYGLNIIHEVMDTVEYERKNGINIMKMDKVYS